jgi:hypothetical protein
MRPSGLVVDAGAEGDATVMDAVSAPRQQLLHFQLPNPSQQLRASRLALPLRPRRRTKSDPADCA